MVQAPTKFELVINIKRSGYNSEKAACTCRRSDRIETLFAALHMSAYGTKRPTADEPSRSALKGKADVVFSGPDSRS
jgi:hypothetical protein